MQAKYYSEMLTGWTWPQGFGNAFGLWEEDPVPREGKGAEGGGADVHPR